MRVEIPLATAPSPPQKKHAILRLICRFPVVFSKHS